MSEVAPQSNPNIHQPTLPPVDTEPRIAQGEMGGIIPEEAIRRAQAIGGAVLNLAGQATRRAAKEGLKAYDYTGEVWHDAHVKKSQYRMERASKRATRLHDKHAFYTNLRSMAKSGGKLPENPVLTVDGKVPRPANFIQRRADKRVSRRALKHAKNITYLSRTEKIHGNADSLPGLTKGQRRLRRAGVTYSAVRGNLTHFEARAAKRNIKAEPVKLGVDSHKRFAADLKKTQRKTNNSLRIHDRKSIRERGIRQRRATKTVGRQFQKKVIHTQKREVARARRASR